jgi:hypothetical protein
MFHETPVKKKKIDNFRITSETRMKSLSAPSAAQNMTKLIDMYCQIVIHIIKFNWQIYKHFFMLKNTSHG